MKTHLIRVFSLAAILVSAPAASLSAAEALLHRGPVFTSPGLPPFNPEHEYAPSHDLKFRREFFIDRKVLASLPETYIEGFSELAVSASDAIALACANVSPDNAKSVVVTNLELLRGPEGEGHRIDFYLISMLRERHEEHRIVLMNRWVLTPRLTPVKK